MKKRPGIGLIGSGFIARFYIRSFRGVRDADLLGVRSPSVTRAREGSRFREQLLTIINRLSWQYQTTHRNHVDYLHTKGDSFTVVCIATILTTSSTGFPVPCHSDRGAS